MTNKPNWLKAANVLNADELVMLLDIIQNQYDIDEDIMARNMVRILAERGTIVSPPTMVFNPRFNVKSNPQLDQECREIWADDSKISAIKHFRQQSGCALKEAKDYVEYLCESPKF